ncbi:hypothetical protein NicSoilB4_05000 [Arthrobacter sp. NicSoilB4]|uniref:aggregation-promoting factor C-terminal-like domain-containing protein n=1 Tax=Arthrobacter sp. NicSoilB4 TaxID=2830997 RepID=UPI001CC52F76|nr:hypothetical protein [Arthrobacter sp. NicSoilB4]BCW65737.1 hypothetical protein NicSoilB4_05000 [Arthrobacter sp. NicSoilB4]
MTDFKPQTRPEGVTTKTRSEPSRHRAEPAKPASGLSRFAKNFGSRGRRAAVVAATCAVLVGVGAAGHASETAARNASAGTSTDAATTADPLTPLDFERVRVVNQTTIPTGDVAAQPAEVKPAEAPAPAAAPAPAPAPAPEPAPAPAPVAIDDPAGAQAYAASQLGSHGWAADQMQCLNKLWTKESDWKTTATNKSSGAYGVVQSLPAEKMASAGADYRTNYRTQINWGLNYVKERYGSPCGALNFHYAHNWY